MRIICPKCATEYFLDSAKLALSGTAVQCSACEHSFTVFGEGEGAVADDPGLPPEPAFASAAPVTPAAPAAAPVTPAAPAAAPVTPAAPAAAPVTPAAPVAPAAPVSPPPPASPAARKPDGRLFLAQGERVYKIKDLPTLQRWIVEKRVLPSDRISEDGTNWDVVSQRADLRPFFAVIEQIKSAKRQLRQREREVREVAQRAVQALAASTSDDLSSSLDSMSVRELASGALDEEFSATPIPDAKSSGVIREATSAMAALGSGASAFDSVPIDSPRHGAESGEVSAAGSGGSSAALGQASDAAMSAPSWGGSGPVSGSEPVLATRDIPVVSDAAASAAGAVETGDSFEEGAEGEGESAFWSQSGWDGEAESSESSASSAGLASGLQDSSDSADEAFDPDQTFDDYKSGGSAGFYIGLIVVAAALSGGLWYFLVGPGRPGASAEATVATLDSSATTSAPEAPKLQVTPSEATVPDKESAVASPDGPVGSAETSTGQVAQPKKVQVSQPVKEEPKKVPPKQQTPPKQQPKPKPKPKPEKKVDHFAAGEAHFERGSFTQAVASYKKALKADPKDFKAAKQLGWAYIEGGQASSARSAFSKAVSLRRSSSEAHYGLGLAYEELGSPSKALSEYEAALKLAPKGPDAPELRALISKMK